MKRFAPWMLIAGSVLIPVIGFAWSSLRPKPIEPALNIAAVSNFEFHTELREVGVDAPSTGGFRPLTWPTPIKAEADATALLQSLDVAIVPGPYTNMVSIQSSLSVNRPILNTIYAYANASTDVWILRQRFMVPGFIWQTYAIVEDKTSTPPTAYFAQIAPGPITFKGEGCFACHPSGPRFIRPMRADLSEDNDVAALFNERIAGNGYIAMHFGASEPEASHGPALNASGCVGCHTKDGDRAPLYHVNDASIRALVASAAMPKDHQITAPEMAEIQTWLKR